MLKIITLYLGKIKILLDILRASLRKRRKPVALTGAITRRLHCVQFLGDSKPTVVVISCLKNEYYHYNGRAYKPSGIYKDWVMFYQDTQAPTAGLKGIVVYPSAHHFKLVFEHYVAYLETTSRGGAT